VARTSFSPGYLRRIRYSDKQFLADLRRASVKAYAQNGTVAMTDLVYPSGEKSRLQLFSLSGRAVSLAREWGLKSRKILNLWDDVGVVGRTHSFQFPRRSREG